MKTKTPHKHAELIKAWADGAEIEQFVMGHEWCPCDQPIWDPSTRYRIKPEPDIVFYGVLEDVGKTFIQAAFTRFEDDGDQLKLTFDGATGKLKSAEVL